MTEADWLECKDPTQMLEFLRGMVSNRKFLLFAVGCWQRWWLMLADERSRNGVLGLEAIAEGQSVKSDSLHLADDGDFLIICGGKYNAGIKLRPRDVVGTAVGSLEMVADAEAEEQQAGQSGLMSILDSYTPLVRDIFGNPFHPVAIRSTWLTSTVVALAEGIYAEKAFDRMPILADALQDAGCENAAILDHCRGDGPHSRGCWAVDLVLGKE